MRLGLSRKAMRTDTTESPRPIRNERSSLEALIPEPQILNPSAYPLNPEP